ncbi:hypothetical protein DV515_00008794 [Chloebia gouldiae]|uniref:Uncharacterized protein n=1 Tax=Chloebia gouldiae TaxID=44316 RepID=A0A3L8SDT2_CHLGU|nr:hypothetical protein DV515_00008794 [Chloebia gouldiae]
MESAMKPVTYCVQQQRASRQMKYEGMENSERSHLSSFTMKLKGKFHSPKIKRTPSKKGKQADLTVKTPEKSVNKVSKGHVLSL